jgi:hypothetical protein
VNIHGGATLNATAPTSGPTAALPAMSTAMHRLEPTSSPATTQTVTGAIYDPSRNVQFAGGTNTGSCNQCTKLVAATMTFRQRQYDR